MDDFPANISRYIWDNKYRLKHAGERNEILIADSWRRIARALAAVEPKDSLAWEQRFFGILRDFKFLPGGRIQAGAGTGRTVTLFNCFVMGAIEDSIPGIFQALQESAVTMQQGGGIGCDFSTLRPSGAQAKGAGGIASGPVSFMQFLKVAADVMRLICHTAYRASIALAEEKGSFPYFDKQHYGRGWFIRSLPDDIQTGIAELGIRNSHLVAIAPPEPSACWPAMYRMVSNRSSPHPIRGKFFARTPVRRSFR